MGLTQHKNAVATIQEVVNLLLLRGTHRQAGRGRVPGARAQQRAGRPHDGHLGAQAAGVPRRARRTSSASSPPRDHGLDTVEAIKAMHDGEVKVFFAPGRQLPLGHAGHRVHRRGAAPLPAHGARLDQAEPRRTWSRASRR